MAFWFSVNNAIMSWVPCLLYSLFHACHQMCWIQNLIKTLRRSSCCCATLQCHYSEANFLDAYRMRNIPHTQSVPHAFGYAPPAPISSSLNCQRTTVLVVSAVWMSATSNSRIFHLIFSSISVCVPVLLSLALFCICTWRAESAF